MRHAVAWAQAAMPHAEQLEAGARRLAMTLGRSLSLALLACHAQWCLDHGFGPRTAAAARRFAMTAVDQIADAPLDDSRLLSAPA
jgi:acyl-CoA dehydrogenase